MTKKNKKTTMMMTTTRMIGEPLGCRSLEQPRMLGGAHIPGSVKPTIEKSVDSHVSFMVVLPFA